MAQPSKEELKNFERAKELGEEIRVNLLPKIVKVGASLSEITKKVEEFILKNKAQIAFPPQFGLNEIAAHQYVGASTHELKQSNIIKCDIGTAFEGTIYDCARSFAWTDQNLKLIQAAEDALEAAIKIAKLNIPINEIGKAIAKQITKHNFQPITNLGGHGVDNYEIHSRVFIPNYDNNNTNIMTKGFYAFEPFATTGVGQVMESQDGGVLHLINPQDTRVRAKKLLDFIRKNYPKMPFAKPWLYQNFKPAEVAIGIFELKQKKIIMEYKVLKEKSGGLVSQAEKTVVIA